MKKYVLGFMLSKEKQHIMLIKKNRPEWQAGRFNGIGGKVEPRESFIQAMERECAEETGIVNHNWVEFATVTGVAYGEKFIIVAYRSISDDIDNAKSLTDEEVSIHYIKHVQDLDLVPNAKILIQAATSEVFDNIMLHLEYLP